MMMTNCAKMRSFNCFTFIIGTMPPGAEPTPGIPTKRNAHFYAVRGGASTKLTGIKAAKAERPQIGAGEGSRPRAGQAIDLPAAPAGSSGGSRPRASEPDEVLDGHAPPAAKERHGSIRELGAVTQRRRQRDRAARLEHDLEFLECDAHRRSHRVVVDGDAARDQMRRRLERYRPRG